jgi:hypothetical protein
MYSGQSVADGVAIMYPSGGALRFSTTTSVGVAGFSEKARFTTDGRFGIGVSAPAGTLDVRSASSTPPLDVWGSGGHLAQITSPGDFLLGGTLPASPAIKLQAGGRIDANGAINAYVGNIPAPPDTSKSVFIGTCGGIITSVIWSNGNVQNTNNSYSAYSDIKLKENIVDAKSQWDDIKALRVRNYNLKDGQTHTQIGLVAQEVESVSPGLVFETADRDADGNDLGTTTKGVQYSVLYMKAVKALQEAMVRIEDLETRLAALEPAAPHKQADPGAK